VTVTGSSTGFGRVLTEYALKKGERVVATLRKPEVLDSLTKQYSSDKMLILKLDVTNKEDVKDAFAKAREHFNRIDVVFNNAGQGAMSEAEGMPDESARALFEVRFRDPDFLSSNRFDEFQPSRSISGVHPS
jgi:NADP-dependent 3-hydroxy acid dehydrogenase YdfG